MLRIAIVISLIANVLTCPYFCMGQIGAGGSPCSELRTCSCCSKSCSSRPSGRDQDTPKVPRESGGNCLCHGAIIDGVKPSEYEIAGADHSFALLAPQNEILGCSPLSQHSQLFFSQFSPLCSGRELCTLICALLI